MRRRAEYKRRKFNRWLIVLVLAVTAWFAGCNLLGPARSIKRVTIPDTGRLEDARELTRSFLEARLSSGDEEELTSYMTTDARNDFKGFSEMPLIGTADAPLLGYRIENGTTVTPGEFGFSVAIQSSNVSQPLASNVREDLLIHNDNGTYRVKSARYLGRTMATVQGSSIVWEMNSLKKTLLYLSELPNDFSPIGSNGVRFGVGKEGFTTLAIRPDNGAVAFGTWGVHGLLGVVSTSDPKILTAIDLYFEGQAKLLVYSPNGRYLAVEEATPVGSSQIRVYNPKEKSLINLDFPAVFPPNLYQMNINRWETDGKTLLIRVSQFSPQAQQDKFGVWAVNVETGEREKIIM